MRCDFCRGMPFHLILSMDHAHTHVISSTKWYNINYKVQLIAKVVGDTALTTCAYISRTVVQGLPASFKFTKHPSICIMIYNMASSTMLTAMPG